MIKHRALIIAAHPDDEVLGCGGLMAKYSNTDIKFRIIFLGEGSSARFSADMLNTNEVKKAIIQRNSCAPKALSILNVESHAFYDLPCGRFDQQCIIDLGKIIEKEITTIIVIISFITVSIF